MRSADARRSTVAPERKGRKQPHLPCLVGALALVCCYAIQVNAVTKTWNSLEGDWFESSNWNPPGVPADGDDVVFSSGTADLSASTTINSLTMTPGAIFFDVGILSGAGDLTIIGAFDWRGGAI